MHRLPVPKVRSLTVLAALSLAMIASGNPDSPADGPKAGTPTVEFKKLPTEKWGEIIPADKNLPADWVKSLTERGEPKHYSGEALMKIGMPVGGITTGLVYLGGDGKLWWWDVFNRPLMGVLPRDIPYKGRGWFFKPASTIVWWGGNYVEPVTTQPSPLQQGFAMQITSGGKTQTRTMDRHGWKDVVFTGSYPVGTVLFSDPETPVKVKLTAFSPFVPLDYNNSSYPATILRYTIENTGADEVKVNVGGWLENVAMLDSWKFFPGLVRENFVTSGKDATIMTATSVVSAPMRPDIMFEDWTRPGFEGWTVEGSAFGPGPLASSDLPPHLNTGLYEGRLVHSHSAAPGANPKEKDAATGKLISPEFTIDRNFAAFAIGGSKTPDACLFKVVVDGNVIRKQAGTGNRKMVEVTVDLRDFQGKTARIEIEDADTVPGGFIALGPIRLTDKDPREQKDWGSMAIAVLGADGTGNADLKESTSGAEILGDFEGGSWGDWTVEGTAFGSQPFTGNKPPQNLVGRKGEGAANSWAAGGDGATGKLTSPTFEISKPYLCFLFGGGKAPENVELGVRLEVDGQVVRSVTGTNSDSMEWVNWEVSEFNGKMGQVIVEDASSGGWGHVVADHFVMSQSPMPSFADSPFIADPKKAASSAPDSPLVGGVARSLTLAPGQSTDVDFVVAWHFVNEPVPDAKGHETGWYYGKRFPDATAVVEHIAKNNNQLIDTSLLWRETWNDSTLPHYFLDRTFIPINSLASTTCYRFGDGRFYTYEGIRSCQGHPNHVWHYAQGHARIFPELERDVLERVWYGFSYKEDGSMDYRGELGAGSAIDGHLGVILCVYRDYLTSPDGAALKRIWPKVKKSLQYAMARDKDQNGLLDTPGLTTLDEPWFGEIPWINSLYAAALKAGEKMAAIMGDTAFAEECRKKAEVTRAAMDTNLFNGEWFVQKGDPANPDKLGAYDTVHIDQVLGQFWAWQVGLGRVLNEDTTNSALRSLWKYNFARNLDVFDAQAHPKGRPYYTDGEGGLLMTANALSQENPYRHLSNFAYYVNETMHGFEYQAAAHMIAEGMVQEGLAIIKNIDDRYDGNKRNPFNEVECGDHYARSMASYGAFIAICGFEYDGPAGHIGFAPKLTPENFKAAFTAAEGWGSFSQKKEGENLNAEIALKWGKLRLRTISLATDSKPATATVKVNGKAVPAELAFADGKSTLSLTEEITLVPNQAVSVVLTQH